MFTITFARFEVYTINSAYNYPKNKAEVKTIYSIYYESYRGRGWPVAGEQRGIYGQDLVSVSFHVPGSAVQELITTPNFAYLK